MWCQGKIDDFNTHLLNAVLLLPQMSKFLKDEIAFRMKFHTHVVMSVLHVCDSMEKFIILKVRCVTL